MRFELSQNLPFSTGSPVLQGPQRPPHTMPPPEEGGGLRPAGVLVLHKAHAHENLPQCHS